ncbi:MLO-like protein 4 [Bienertia sinuspersici]
MGSKCKKALVAESVRDSLHNWCKRVKARSKNTARSVCSLDERDEVTTVASLTLSPSSSVASLNEIKVADINQEPQQVILPNSIPVSNDDFSFRMSQYISQSAENSFPDPDMHEHEIHHQSSSGNELGKVETLADLLQKT